MPFCSNCGNAIQTGSKFCSNCGTPMTLPDKAACPVCHKPVVGNEKFCMYCGNAIVKPVSGNAPVSKQAATSQPKSPNRSPARPSPVYNPSPASMVVKKKKKGGCLWKSFLFLLVLIVGGITALYYLGDDPGFPQNGQGELTGTDIPGIVSIDETMPEDAIVETAVEPGDPRQAAKTVEDAFARADTAMLKQMLTPTSREIYKEAFREIKPYMNEYSKAFSKRKLKISTPIYSLYEFTDEDGKKYTAEFVLSDDGQWKLVRF